MTHRGSLLIVDPKKTSGELARALSEGGYLLTPAENGEDALLLAAAGHYDLVLLALDLPDAHGLAVLRDIRAADVMLPIVMIARASSHEVAEALRLGASDYLPTPIEPSLALARVRTHVSHRRTLQELRESEKRFAAALAAGGGSKSGRAFARAGRDGGSAAALDPNVTDPLTHLPNRMLFVHLLERAIKRAARRPSNAFALLVLGLDRFKAVNHSLGPGTADRLLVEVAQRLQATLRCTDAMIYDHRTFTLARLGGDEFTVLLEDVVHASDAMRVAERLRSALNEPFDIDGQQVFTSAAVGITVSTTGYGRPEETLQDAGIALDRAKAGPSPVEIFDPAMRARALYRLQMETDLRKAIDNLEFSVLYQPIVALATGRISGFEALVRWRHPTRGLLLPDAFIPIAEDTGMIRHIGRLTLAEACRQMADWQRRYGDRAPGVICVNISGTQLDDVNLPTAIEAILEETGLAPSRLKLEITESALISDPHAVEGTLRRLHAVGVEWSIDDFGTGYSSLSSLHRLQADTVKVDRSFVSRIDADDRGSAIVGAIVALAHNFGMDVVAEGVETAEQLSQLKGLGCEHVQGFYFSEPVDRGAADDLIASQPWRDAARRELTMEGARN